MKKILLVLFLISLFIPKTSLALGSQRCWTENKCKAYRQTFIDIDQTGEGFYAASKHDDAALECGGVENAAGDPLGFCLPAGKSVTKISFGGKNEFANIGEFIQFFYQYGFMIASIIAVLMVITGGVMWIFSGGSSDTITSAKKKISGAIMGIVLLALSYSILNLVNPYLVNMRLPEIWAINRADTTAPTCDLIENKSDKALAYAFSDAQSKTITDKEKLEKYQSVTFDMAGKNGKCGENYFVDGTQGQTCQGIFCKEGGGEICFQGLKQKNISCNPGVIAGIIYNSKLSDQFTGQNKLASYLAAVFGEGWDWQWANEPILYAVCEDGSFYGVAEGVINNVDEDNLKLEYSISGSTENIIKQAQSECDNKLKGLSISLDMDEIGIDSYDERHLLGKDGVDLGDYPCYNPFGCSSDSIFAGESNLEKIMLNIDKELLISVEYLTGGSPTNIDAGKICDIDDDEDRKSCYGKYGYK